MLLPEFTVETVTNVNNYVSAKKTWSNPNRSVHILGYQFAGCYVHDFNGQEAEFKEGHIIFINKSSPYHVVTKEVGNSVSLAFTAKEPIDAPFFAVPCMDQHIRQLFMKAYHVWTKHDAYYRTDVTAILYELLAEINRYSDRRYVAPSSRERIHRSADVIEQSLGGEIDMAKLARDAGLSERRFRELFREVFQVPPARYIRDRRIRLACEYLSTGQYSVGEVAAMTGFVDAAYFSKCFKSVMGVAPTLYGRRKD